MRERDEGQRDVEEVGGGRGGRVGARNRRERSMRRRERGGTLIAPAI